MDKQGKCKTPIIVLAVIWIGVLVLYAGKVAASGMISIEALYLVFPLIAVTIVVVVIVKTCFKNTSNNI